VADLAITAQEWIEDQLRDPRSEPVAYLRHLAALTADNARAAVPRRTGLTLESVHVEEVTGSDGFIYERVLSRNPVTDVLNSASGVIRNRGRDTRELTRTGRRKRSRTGRSVRLAHPFMREALFETTVVEGI
jgi:hypothetical protein